MQAQAEKSRAFPSPEIGREKQHLNSRAASCIMKATSFAGVMELVDVTDSKSVGSDTVWVRVPPPAPRRSKLCIACSDSFTKVRARSRRCSSFPNRTRFAGLRFGFGCKPGSVASIVLQCSTWPQSPLCDHVFLCPWQKRCHPPAPLLLLSKSNPLRGTLPQPRERSHLNHKKLKE